MKSSNQNQFSGLGHYNFDPRTKIALLAICILIATLAPSLNYICLLIGFIAIFGCINGKLKNSIIGTIFFIVFYLFANYILSDKYGITHTMFIAWMGLFYKVYPCAMLAGIVLSTTRVNEFLSAMQKAHIPQKIVIPFAVMLRYIPTVKEDWHYIKDALQLRNVNPSFIGFLSNPGLIIECIYVPLMMTASKTADELSIASITRGIENPAPRTCLVQIRFGYADIIVLICFALLFIGMLLF